MGTTPPHRPPANDAIQMISPNNGGDKRSEIGGGMWVSRRPHPLRCKKRKPPIIGGLNEMKLGWHDKYHAAPLLLIENPPIIGGNNPAQTRRRVDFTPPRFCRCWKESPQTMRGIKKLERSGVWDAHRSFASGRPNEAVCGMHTASFASGRSNEMVCGLHTASLASGTTVQEGGGKCPPPHPRFPLSLSFPLFLPPLTPFSALLAPSVFVTWHSTAGAFAV